MTLMKAKRRQRSKRKVYFLLALELCVAVISTVAVGFLFYIIYYNLQPDEGSKTTTSLLRFNSSLFIDLNPSGTIKIIDSNHGEESNLSVECSIYQNNYTDQCQSILKVNATQYEKVVIFCPAGECKVNVESDSFRTDELFVYGQKISMKAKVLNAEKFFFDTIEGNLLVELFSGSSASVSTTQGDIIIQSEQETKLTTLSNSKSVCVTGEQGWKDSLTKITNLDDAFVVKDPKTDVCSSIALYSDRDYERMVELSKHVLFDSILKNTSNQSIDSLCVELTDIMILKSVSDTPSSISSFIEIRAANYEGNIHINVKNSTSDFTNPIPNSVYETSKLQISNIWSDKLNQTFQDIAEQGRFNEIVFLNFGYESSPDMVWIVLFSPLYLHFSPKMLSLFSLSVFGSKQERFDVGLSQGYCPRHYKYVSTEEFYKYDDSKEMSFEMNSEQEELQGTLEDFFTLINQEPYMILPMSFYDHFELKNKASYPSDDDENLEKQIPLSSVSKIIFLLIVIVQFFTLPEISYLYLKRIARRNRQEQNQKIIFHLLQLIKPENKDEFEFPTLKKLTQNGENINVTQTRKTGGEKYFILETEFEFNHLEEAKSNGVDEKIKQKRYKVESECKGEYEKILVNINIIKLNALSFYGLVSQGSTWIQKRQINSLDFFYSLFFIQHKNVVSYEGSKASIKGIDSENLTEKSVVMQLSELKQTYSFFCYCFNLQQVNVLSEENKRLLNAYDFEICYEKRIIFDESSDAFKDWTNSKQYFAPSVIRQFKKLHQTFPNRYNISLPYFLLELSQKSMKENVTIKETLNTQRNTPVLKHFNPCMIKVSPNLVVSQIQDSDFVINHKMIKFLKHKFCNDYLGIKRKIQIPQQVSKTIQNEIMEEDTNEYTIQYNKFEGALDYLYQKLLFFGGENINRVEQIFQKTRYFVQTVIFFVSPFIVYFLLLIGTWINYRENNKTYEQRQIIKEGKLEEKSNWNFILIAACGVLEALFLIELLMESYFSISAQNKTPSIVTFQNAEDKIQDETLKNHNVFKFIFQKISILVCTILLALSILYLDLCAAFIFVGSILIPNVLLPMAIFFLALATVIINQVTSYNQLSDQGKQQLNDRFKKNLLSKFKEQQKKQKIEEIIKKQKQLQKSENKDNKENKDNETQQNNLSVSETIESQETPEDEELIYPNLISNRELKHKDSEYFHLGDLEEMFYSIDFNKDDEVGIQEIFNKFNQIGMPISPQLLDQMVSYAKVMANPNTEYFKLGSPNNFLLFKKEFSYAVQYLLDEKVTSALQILDISLGDLVLMIVSVVLQSIIASAFVYSVFRGFSTNNEPLVLGIQNIASFIGFLGIFYQTRNDQSKKVEDKQIINEVIQEVENMFHCNNPNVYDLPKSAEANTQDPSKSQNAKTQEPPKDQETKQAIPQTQNENPGLKYQETILETKVDFQEKYQTNITEQNEEMQILNANQIGIKMSETNLNTEHKHLISSDLKSNKEQHVPS